MSEANPSKDKGRPTDRAALVAATANRLRLVQADFADENDQVRRDYLADEIQRVLATIVPADREPFLQELKDRFPTWDTKVDVSRSAAAPAQSPTDAKELKDPSFLVSRLIEIAPGLSEQQRQNLTMRLAEAGLSAPSGEMDWPPQHAQAVRTKVQAGPTDPLDAGRVLELLTLLIDFTSSLDQLVWTTWRTVAPKSTIRRTAGMLKTMGRFAAADADTPRGAVTQDLDRLRQLVAAIISAISQAGRQFAHSHAVKFSPDEIENLASMERGSMFASKESKCWNKYKELAAGRDEASIEAEIMQAIADYAESLMKGLSR